MRCHWVNDPEIGRWHYPGCIGGAVYGPSGCTCGASARKETAEARISKLEEKLERIEALLSKPNK